MMVVDNESEDVRLSIALVSGVPILEGILLKKNKWYMKQERRFKLYANGQIKYFKDAEMKGCMELTKDARARKLNKYEVEVTLPKKDKTYTLMQHDLTKVPMKTEKFSCLLDDWVDAINSVCTFLGKEIKI
jgi:hypothetical protein